MPGPAFTAEEQRAMALGVQPSQLLIDMRWVYSNPKAGAISDGEMALRQMMKESPKDFMAQMTALEKVWGPMVVECLAKNQKNGESKQLVDKGHDKLVELIDRLLEEWEDAEPRSVA